MEDNERRVLRQYQRVLMGEGRPPAVIGPWKPVAMEVDGDEFLMAQCPDGSLAGIGTAAALDRLDAAFVRVSPPGTGPTAALTIPPIREPDPPDRGVLVIPMVTDALAFLRRPKREGNRAERRARGRAR